jgi:DNA ligase D-like protein (predicted 3'-phosphoesterase)
MNPRDKRLAIPTGDHPIEYAEFEGVIPKGEYGAGTVLVWDLGTYQNLRIQGDSAVPMARGLAEGHLIFWLEGKKLRGGFALHRFREGEEESWLLIKLDDEEASRNHDPVKMQPESVLSGRILEEIAEEG